MKCVLFVCTCWLECNQQFSAAYCSQSAWAAAILVRGIYRKLRQDLCWIYTYIYRHALCTSHTCGARSGSPFSHGPLNPDSRSGPNTGSTQMCVHTAIIVWCQYAGNPVVEKMAFHGALLLFIFFWLRWRRLRLARARIRKIPAVSW